MSRAMGEPLLRVDGLRKSYGPLVAVEAVSFAVEAGEIFGLLGPNGAGKSTTIGCICGLLAPDRGTVTVGGADVGREPQRAKRKLGVVPQDLALYDELTVEQNLASFGGLYPGLAGKRLRERTAWCLDFVQLAEHRARPVAQLSGGMKRRLNLAVALLHDPELVLADEPTVGVDPQSRNHIFENVEKLARAGKAVVYTTHYMEEVERLCGRAAIIDQGKVIAADTLSGLLGLAQEARRLRIGWRQGWPDEAVRGELERRFHPATMNVEAGELRLSFAGEVPLTELVAWLAERGWPPAELSMERPTLEDAFLKLTGRKLRDA
jgi:ABC-2 type transport system ATP-binding protein